MSVRARTHRNNGTGVGGVTLSHRYNFPLLHKQPRNAKVCWPLAAAGRGLEQSRPRTPRSQTSSLSTVSKHISIPVNQ